MVQDPTTIDDLLGNPVNIRETVTTALVQPETLNALLTAMDDADAPEQADPLATAMLDALDKYIRQKIGPLPWVHDTLPGRVLSVQAHTCTVSVAGIDHDVSDVLFGPNRPAVGDVYPVRFPVALPPEGTPLALGPVPYGNPWIKVPGGMRLFYACGRLATSLPRWPLGPTVSVQALDWPLPTAPDVNPADLTATAAGSFDFTAESLDVVPNAGGTLMAGARFLGVDGLGNVWAMVEVRRNNGAPFGLTRSDGTHEAGRTTPPQYRSTLGRIPAYGTGPPAAHLTCPDGIVPLAVDSTPGQSNLLSVSEGVLVARVKCRDQQFFLPPAPPAHYCWEAIGNNGTLDHYTLSVGRLNPNDGLVTWSEVGSIRGEGEWPTYYNEIGSKNSPSDPYVKIQSANSQDYWPDTYHELLTPGTLFGFRQRTFFAYAYPALELAHTIWTETVAGVEYRRWRVACVTYPAVDAKDGPLALFNADGQVVNGESVLASSTSPPLTKAGALVERYTPYHQELLDAGRWATYVSEDGTAHLNVRGGLPYALWGSGPGSAGDWVLQTTIPSRLLADTHDQTDLRARITTARGEHGLGGGLTPFPASGQFTLARVIARSLDGQDILAEDTDGTYNPDDSSLSPGRLWQTTDGGATWTRLAFRITDLPAPAATVPQGYGFLVAA